MRHTDSFLDDYSDNIKMRFVCTCDEGVEPTHPHFFKNCNRHETFIMYIRFSDLKGLLCIIINVLISLTHYLVVVWVVLRGSCELVVRKSMQLWWGLLEMWLSWRSVAREESRLQRQCWSSGYVEVRIHVVKQIKQSAPVPSFQNHCLDESYHRKRKWESCLSHGM